MSEQIQAWWAQRNDGGHPESSEDWLARYAHELSCLFPKGGTLVDVGCGSAQLLTHLAPNYERVIGIDYSPSMLAAARDRVARFGLTNVQLELGNACRFPATVSRADLIISCAVAQYLTPDDIRQHLRECRRVLSPSGVVGICEIPWVNLRWPYRLGMLDEGRSYGWLRTQARRLRSFLRYCWHDWRGRPLADSIGYWHSRREIQELAAEAGFDCQLFTCWHYSSQYRFHARLASAGERSSVACESDR